MLFVGEGSRASARKPKCVGIDCSKKIPGASRNHLTRAAKAQALETQRPAALVANRFAVTTASD